MIASASVALTACDSARGECRVGCEAIDARAGSDATGGADVSGTQRDASEEDAGDSDAEPLQSDGATTDGEGVDATGSDASADDAAAPDASTRDAATGDASQTDGALADAAGGDAGGADARASDASLDGGPLPTCGNGVVDSTELCDTAITTGLGACPRSCRRLDLCVARQLTGSACQAQCVDTPITAVSSTPDMCCAGAGDPDCPAPYPITIDLFARSSGTGGTCSGGTQWQVARVPLRAALAPTCGVPVVLSVGSVSPGVGSGQPATLNVSLTTAGASYGALAGHYDANGPGSRQEAFMFSVEDTNAFAALDFEARSCSSSAFTTTFGADFRPLAALAVSGASGAVRPQLAGDHVGQYVLFETGSGGLMVAAGRAAPGYFETVGINPLGLDFQPGEWAPRFNPISLATSGIEPSLALESNAGPTDLTTWPRAHVAWLDASRSTLRYASVDSTGAVINSHGVVNGAQLGRPELIRWDETHLALSWLEQTNLGSRRLRFARLLLSSGTIDGAIIDLTGGQNEILDHALAARDGTGTSFQAAAAWIEREPSGALLRIVGLDGSGTQLGAVEIVSSGAVAPERPSLEVLSAAAPLFRVLWTDRRSGAAALYLKDNRLPGTYSTPTAFAPNPESVVTAPGEVLHFGRLPRQSNRSDAGGADSSYAQIIWESEGPSGDAVHFAVHALVLAAGYERSSGTTLSLSCNDASAPALFSARGVGYAPRDSTRQLAVWVESGTVRVTPIAMRISARTPF